jgi:hypothetical protein
MYSKRFVSTTAPLVKPTNTPVALKGASAAPKKLLVTLTPVIKGVALKFDIQTAWFILLNTLF